MIFGILVLYYKAYIEKAISEFEKIIYKLDKNAKIIIVANSANYISCKHKIIIGSNKFAEFSGWQEGLDYIYKLYGDKISCVVFANDTFCHHRNYSIFHSYSFVKLFKNFMKEKKYAAIAGEYCVYKKGLKIDNILIDGWISTYLYAINKQLISTLEWNIIVDKKYLMLLFPGESSYDRFFGDILHISMRELLIKWLFGKEKSWYQSEPLTIKTAQKFTLKAKAIYMEMHLSKRIKESGAKVYNLNNMVAINFIKLYYKFKNIIKSKNIEIK